MNLSFPKEFRLLKPKDFQYLRRGARYVNTPFLRFYFKKSAIQDIDHARLGLSISKKAGNAVHRNFIKRRVRECFRTSFLRGESLDILVIASPRLKAMKGDKVAFREAVNRSLEKAFDENNKFWGLNKS